MLCSTYSAGSAELCGFTAAPRPGVQLSKLEFVIPYQDKLPKLQKILDNSPPNREDVEDRFLELEF